MALKTIAIPDELVNRLVFSMLAEVYIDKFGAERLNQILNTYLESGMNKDDAKAALFEVADVLDAIGIDWYLGFGTLLGAVRTGNFLDGDVDIDIIVKHEDMLPKIDEMAQKLGPLGKLEYLSQPYPYQRMLKVFPHNIMVDICNFDYDPARKTRFHNFTGTNWFVYPADLFDKVEEVELCGRKFKALDPLRYCELTYGVGADKCRQPGGHRCLENTTYYTELAKASKK